MSKKNSEMQHLSKVFTKEQQRTPNNPKGGTPPVEHQFQPGTEWKGNRAGRPPRSVFINSLKDRILYRPATRALRRTVEADYGCEIPDDATLAEVILMVLVHQAAKGNVSAKCSFQYARDHRR